MYCILSVLNQVWENYGQKQAYYLTITVLEYSIYLQANPILNLGQQPKLS